jgi:cell division protein FtsW (lipid II flippase)
VGGLGALGAIAMAIFPQVIAERVQSFIDRWNASPPTEFIANQAEFTSGGQAGLLGKGLGRATNSARIFGETQLIETWFPKILYEVGPIGLVAFLFFVTVLTVVTFKVYRSIKDRSLRSYGACFWVFILFISYNTYYYPLDVDPVAIYYWIFAGVLLKLPELDRQDQEKLLEAEPDLLPAKNKKLR